MDSVTTFKQDMINFNHECNERKNEHKKKS